MVLSFLSRWIFRIPVALVLAFSWSYAVPGTGLTVAGLEWGVAGLWWAYAVGALLSSIIAVVWFRRGTWTGRVVDNEQAATSR